MSLRRLYWVPNGSPATAGAYVNYPLDDLLRLVALESRRQGCAVVGEDLGTVPEGFREAMQTANVLSYRVFRFERRSDGGFVAPSDYPALAATSAATHDLATLKGFWLGRDIEWRQRLGVYPDAAAEATEIAERRRDRRLVLAALAGVGLLAPERFAEFLPADGEPSYTEELGEAMPLTTLAPGGPDALRLGSLFSAAFAGLSTVHDDLDALALAIDGLDDNYGGVDVTFSSVTVAPNANPDLIDVGFTIAASRVVTPVVVFSDGGAVNLNGGGLPVNLGLASTLNFQLDKTKLPATPELAFYVAGEPTLDVTLAASGPVLGFNSRLGFADIVVGGAATINGDLEIGLHDPLIRRPEGIGPGEI